MFLILEDVRNHTKKFSKLSQSHFGANKYCFKVFMVLSQHFLFISKTMSTQSHHHNLCYTLRVYIQYNKICSDSKVHGIDKALNFYK